MSNSQTLARLVAWMEKPDGGAYEDIIDSFVRLGRDAVPALRSFIAKKKVACVAIEALARIGYPDNAEAIHDLVEELSYVRSDRPKQTRLFRSFASCTESSGTLDRLLTTAELTTTFEQPYRRTRFERPTLNFGETPYGPCEASARRQSTMLWRRSRQPRQIRTKKCAQRRPHFFVRWSRINLFPNDVGPLWPQTPPKS